MESYVRVSKNLLTIADFVSSPNEQGVVWEIRMSPASMFLTG